MSIFHRIARIAAPFRGALLGGLGLIMVSSVLDTAVITFLFTAMVSVVLGPETGQQTKDIIIFKWNLTQSLTTLLGQINPLTALLVLAGLTLLAVLLKSASDARYSYLMYKFANLTAKEFRKRLFNHLLRMSPSYFERESTGAHLSRITNDVSTLQLCLGPQLAEILQAPVVVGISIAIMFYLSWQLTLTALCLAPLIAIIISIGGRKLRKLTVHIQERMADFNAGLVERLSTVRVVQSFVREPYESTQVEKLNDDFYRSNMRSVRLAETIAPGIEFIAVVGMIIGIVVGGIEKINGHIDPQSFLLFLFLAQKAGTQFKRLSRVNQVRQQAAGAAERIFALLDIEPDIRDAADAQPLPAVSGEIVFNHVSFHYRDGEAVLRDINLTVAPGEVIALVGPSGSGKTTLVNLLPRFYDPIAGGIAIDSYDLRTVTLASLRAQVGLVPQETVLFGGTIYENIRYGRLDAEESEIIDAARAANALEFIERLPDGFQTIVGERGARLSGGQRQRVAIARALLKNPRILILDEATSALDTESEHLVQQALERLMQNRTTFVIAHRLSTIQNASRILVLHHGQIVETGTHTQLLAADGLYRRLYEMQFRNTGQVVEAGE